MQLSLEVNLVFHGTNLGYLHSLCTRADTPALFDKAEV